MALSQKSIHMEEPMHTDRPSPIAAASRNARAREIHELTYLKHRTGASEADIWQAIERVGSNRVKVERELTRQNADGQWSDR
jgi:hypothetical protein